MKGHRLLIDATEETRFVRPFEGLPANLCAVHAEALPQLAPEAMLVRPDGHAAWTANEDSADAKKLREALAYWFGMSCADSAAVSSIHG